MKVIVSAHKILPKVNVKSLCLEILETDARYSGLIYNCQSGRRRFSHLPIPKMTVAEINEFSEKKQQSKGFNEVLAT